MKKQQMDSTSWLLRTKNAIKPTKEELGELVMRMPAKEDRPEIQLFGKKIKIPRTQKLFGSFPYAYSKIKMEPDSNVPGLVARCLKYANDLFPEFPFNGALVNLYLDGMDSVSPHSDNEPQLNPKAPILSFSFGASRTFVIKAKKDKTDAFIKKLRMDLEHDDLVVMCGDLQAGFLHEVPKTKRKIEFRINVTVRSFFGKRKKK